ncbi:MAG: putative O-glycosylation ligase, exosortase A system-associated [Alphaproteobacteria bacterium]|nr:putative O-glycosylation ligase, exosortase A system-associated [Alphaproteobacteria bacterium]
MRGILLLVVFAATTPATLYKPHVGVLVWSWVSYMNPHRLVYGFVQALPLALIVASATLLAWVLSREAKRIPMGAITVLLGVWALWFSLTTLFALYPDSAYADWDRAIKVILMNGFVTLGLITTRERLHHLLWAIVISLGFYGIRGGLFTIFTLGEHRVYGPSRSFIADNNQSRWRC